MRKKLAAATQTTVLVRSRRRCCVCFGLNRDTSLKSGQIAHLDRDNTNDAEDNLAFMCFDHHDEYDSRTSQRKNFTPDEVKVFRAELHDAVGKALSQSVHFGRLTIPKADPYAGQYIRIGGESADITLTPVPDGMDGTPRYAVTGNALHGADRQWGPNLGGLCFVSILFDAHLTHEEDRTDGTTYSVRARVTEDSLVVEEENFLGMYGMGVTFQGEYRKAE